MGDELSEQVLVEVFGWTDNGDGSYSMELHNGMFDGSWKDSVCGNKKRVTYKDIPEWAFDDTVLMILLLQISWHGWDWNLSYPAGPRTKATLTLRKGGHKIIRNCVVVGDSACEAALEAVKLDESKDK